MAEFEPATFAREFQRFLEAYKRLIPPERAPIRDLLDEHFARPTGDLPGVAEELAKPEHPNLQLALDELTADHGWQAVGLPLGLRRYGGFSLASLATNRPVQFGFPPPEPGPVEYLNVRVGPSWRRPPRATARTTAPTTASRGARGTSPPQRSRPTTSSRRSPPSPPPTHPSSAPSSALPPPPPDRS